MTTGGMIGGNNRALFSPRVMHWSRTPIPPLFHESISIVHKKARHKQVLSMSQAQTAKTCQHGRLQGSEKKSSSELEPSLEIIPDIASPTLQPEDENDRTKLRMAYTILLSGHFYPCYLGITVGVPI